MSGAADPVPLATGIGSFPGDHQRDHDEALRLVIGELAEGGDGHGIPFVPEVPGRGAPAQMTGRTLGLLAAADLWDADLQPEGWRLTGTSGAPPIDQRRARSLLGQDLDGWEERIDGYAGPVKTQLAGPWTLAATVERPRGDKVLADHGARRDLAQALAAAAAEHVADLRRRTPGADRIVVQIDEPGLPAVLAAQVPTASGFGKHRVVHPPEADQAMRWVCEAIAAAGAEPWLHCCAPGAPIELVRGAGAQGVAVDLDLVDAAGHDALAQALEDGAVVALGVVPTTGEVPGERAVLERVRRWLDLTGLDPVDHLDRVVLTPACGLAGSSGAHARRAIQVALGATRALLDASHQ
ncbi:uroporphyrinogen decarboxylase/cobalamine-independent methonine synthase family protein [Nocardioides sambongensis]|uniref:methionine synthase n=1 Tax=Nocardioides sambongensis TaxID=2589074 RepID=UPI00112AB561|nr:methionine synthase [Nocardioides sambongensis]